MELTDDEYGRFLEDTKLSQRLEIVRWERQRAQSEFWAPAGGWVDSTCATAEVQPGEVDKPATWPPDDGWHFRPGEFAYRGKRGKAVGKIWEMLKLLATARAPVDRDSIRAAVWPEDIQGLTEDQAISQTIKKGRAVIRAAFRLPASVNPIPSVDFGQRAAWRIDEGVIESSAAVAETFR